MPVPIEKQLYDSANAYYQGANVLMLVKPLASSAEGPVVLLVQPAVTCAALSLKLYLKCLLALDGNDNDEIYRIADLYRSFSDDKKKMLLQKFDEFSNTALSPDDLLKHLDALDNAFVKWRYIHEEDAKSVNLEDLEEMILAAKAAIKAVRPDWE